MTKARWIARANEQNRDDFESATYTFNATRWNAQGNGTTDDTAAIQAMLTAGRGLGGTYLFPPGNYLVSDTLTITDQAGVHMLGTAGQHSSNNIANAWIGGTIFTWNANDATKPFLRVSDVDCGVFENFFMKCTAATRCKAGVEVFNTSDTSHITTTSNVFRNVHFNGNTDGLEVGFLLPATAHVTGGSDNNNDYNHFEDCTAVNVRVAGALVNHSQSKANRFVNCQFRGLGTPNAKACVGAGYWYDAGTDTEYFNSGNGGTAGSFQWYGGGASWVDYAFVIGGGNGDTYVIEGANMEKMGRILYGAGPASSGPQVTIIGSRFAGHDPTVWDSDLKMIQWDMPGPLTLIGNRVEDALAKATTISIGPSTNGPRCGLTLIGNSFETDNITTATLVTGTHLTLDAKNNIWHELTGDTVGSYDNTSPNAVMVEERTFTETSGAGVFTASVTVPAGATIQDIKVWQTAKWTSQTSALMDVGDADVDGWFTQIDLKGTDLEVGEEINFENPGGRAGTYLDTAIGKRSAAYSASARTITGILTKVGTTGTAGRTRMLVQWSVHAATAAVKV